MKHIYTYIIGYLLCVGLTKGKTVT